MNRDLKYYQDWLRHLEYTQLEGVGELLHIEMSIYEIRKILQQIRDLNEFNNPSLDRVKVFMDQLKSKQRILNDELDNLELDISHAKFMIDLLNQTADGN